MTSEVWTFRGSIFEVPGCPIGVLVGKSHSISERGLQQPRKAHKDLNSANTLSVPTYDC